MLVALLAALAAPTVSDLLRQEMQVLNRVLDEPDRALRPTSLVREFNTMMQLEAAAQRREDGLMRLSDAATLQGQHEVYPNILAAATDVSLPPVDDAHRGMEPFKIGGQIYWAAAAPSPPSALMRLSDAATSHRLGQHEVYPNLLAAATDASLPPVDDAHRGMEPFKIGGQVYWAAAAPSPPSTSPSASPLAKLAAPNSMASIASIAIGMSRLNTRSTPQNPVAPQSNGEEEPQWSKWLAVLATDTVDGATDELFLFWASAAAILLLFACAVVHVCLGSESATRDVQVVSVGARVAPHDIVAEKKANVQYARAILV